MEKEEIRELLKEKLREIGYELFPMGDGFFFKPKEKRPNLIPTNTQQGFGVITGEE